MWQWINWLYVMVGCKQKRLLVSNLFCLTVDTSYIACMRRMMLPTSFAKSSLSLRKYSFTQPGWG